MLYLVLDGLGSKEEHLIRTRFTSQHSNSHIPCLNLKSGGVSQIETPRIMVYFVLELLEEAVGFLTGGGVTVGAIEDLDCTGNL